MKDQYRLCTWQIKLQKISQNHNVGNFKCNEFFTSKRHMQKCVQSNMSKSLTGTNEDSPMLFLVLPVFKNWNIPEEITKCLALNQLDCSHCKAKVTENQLNKSAKLLSKLDLVMKTALPVWATAQLVQKPAYITLLKDSLEQIMKTPSVVQKTSQLV